MRPKPLHIGFLSTVHPHPRSPGKGTFNRTMLEGLAAVGATITSVVPVPWREQLGSATPLETGYNTEYPTWWYLPRVAPLALATTMRWSLGKVLRETPKPDLVLGYWVDPDGTVASDWARQMGVPYVQMVGGSDILQLAQNPNRSKRMMSTLARADKIVTIGDHLRHTLIERGVAAERIEPISRGVDRSRFTPGDKAAARTRLGLPPDRPLLCWAGRMVPIKGLDVLLAALADPELSRLDPLTVLIGDGPLRGELQRAAGSLRDDSVRFAGRVSQAELPDWYRAADLVVLPSQSEGIPNVLLEALACGTGFVASDVGSIAELTSHPQRDLVAPDRPDLLAKSLTQRLRHGSAPALIEVPDSRSQAASLYQLLQQVATLRPRQRE